MTNPEEAIGIARAARDHGLPAAISFTLETDGRLPDGQSLSAAVERVDAETDRSVAYFMINCAHPTHFAGVLEDNGAWRVASAACAPTPRPRATPSSMRPRSSMRATRRRSAPSTAHCARSWAPSRSSAAAAAPTTVTWTDRPRLDGLRRLASLHGSRVVAVAAGVALAAGGFALGRVTADTDAGHDAGVRQGHAAGLQEGRALQATGSAARAPGPPSTLGMRPAPTTSSRASMAGGRCRSPTSSRSPAGAAGSPTASIRGARSGVAQATAATRTATAARKSSRRSATAASPRSRALCARRRARRPPPMHVRGPRRGHRPRARCAPRS